VCFLFEKLNRKYEEYNVTYKKSTSGFLKILF
jgi:hypothetical protein